MKTKENMKKKLMIDMDGVVADYINPEYNKKFKNYKEEGFFKGLPTVIGTEDALSELDSHYDIFFLTTAPWSSPIAWKEKREWIGDKFGSRYNKKIIMTHRKDLVIGDFLIDDRPQANGAGDFKGTLIHFGSNKFPGWDEVLNFLIKGRKRQMRQTKKINEIKEIFKL